MPLWCWMLLAACLAGWPQAAPAETDAAERWPWIAVPADVRSAYRALRNTPAFAAAVPRVFASEGGDPMLADGWQWAFTSSNFRWAHIDVNGDGVSEVILVLSAPGQPCDDDGCLAFVMVGARSDNWRIACELKTMAWSWPRLLRRRSLGWHWFTTGDLTVGWRRGAPGPSGLDGPVCYRAGRTRPPDFGSIGSLSQASVQLDAFMATDSPYAAVLRGTTAEDIGRPRGPEDWRRRFDALLHLRWMTVHLETINPGAVALMLASPMLCSDGRCPVAIVSQPTNVAPRTTLCTLDVPWDADVVRLPGRDHGIQRLAIGDRLIGWREAPENPRGIACTVTELPPPR